MDGVGTELFDFPDGHAALHAAGLRLIADGRGNAAFLAGDHRLALERRIDGLLAGRKNASASICTMARAKEWERQRLHTGGLVSRAYLRTTAVTTATFSSSSAQSAYSAGWRAPGEESPRLRRYFMVHSPSTSAMTISPTRGAFVRSTITRSPSRIPASIIESPLTLRIYEASLFSMRYSSRLIVSINSSSAGRGSPLRRCRAGDLAIEGAGDEFSLRVFGNEAFGDETVHQAGDGLA